MKKFAFIGLAFLLLLSGCSSKNDSKDTETKTEEQEAIIPKYQINEEYYRTILPFEPSEARGQTVSNLNTRYDMDEMELGLMRIAQNNFNTDDYYFKEGQYLDASTVKSWLKRKYTSAQLKEREMDESENLGLNPIIADSGDIAKNNEESPLYLAHILEHDYMVQKSNDSVGLGGVVIGLALNSVHYYQKEAYGATFDVEISEKKMLSEGKKIAEEVLSRLRQMEGLEDVPIIIALYKQEANTSIVPGNFVAYTEISKGSNKIGSWKELNEEYVLFPSDDAQENHRDDSTTFTNFKQDIVEYFPNYSGVIGRGYYIDDQLQQLKIEIPIQFYGKTEAVGFTQYVAGLVLEYFPNYISVEVSVTSSSGTEALIVRNAGESEPFVHIYQ